MNTQTLTDLKIVFRCREKIEEHLYQRHKIKCIRPAHYIRVKSYFWICRLCNPGIMINKKGELQAPEGAASPGLILTSASPGMEFDGGGDQDPRNSPGSACLDRPGPSTKKPRLVKDPGHEMSYRIDWGL